MALRAFLRELSHLAGRYRPAFISDAKRHHAAIRLVVSTMSGGRPTKFARLHRHLGLPRLHVSAEPVGTVRWGHASAPLSIAPLPVPTGIRDPASSSQEAFATRAIRLATSRTRASAAGAARADEVKVFQLPEGAGPHDVAPAPEGRIWYSAQGSGALGIIEPATGAVRQVSLGEG